MNRWRPLWWFIIYDHRSNLLYIILIGVYGFLNTIGTKSYYWQCSPCWISLHEQHNNFYVIYFRVAHLITTWNLSLIYMFYLHLIYIYMITHPHISVVYLSIYIYIYIYISSIENINYCERSSICRWKWLINTYYRLLFFSFYEWNLSKLIKRSQDRYMRHQCW